MIIRIVFGLFTLIFVVWGLIVGASYALGECFPDHSCGTNRAAEMWSVLILLIAIPVASGLAGRRNPVLGPIGLVLGMIAIVIVPYFVGQMVHWLVA